MGLLALNASSSLDCLLCSCSSWKDECIPLALPLPGKHLSIQVMSVQFVLDAVGFFAFFLWLIYECPAIWSSGFSLSSFQINSAW